MRKLLGMAVALAVAFGGVVIAASPAQAAPKLRFHRAQYDSPGKDNRSNTSLNNEWVSLINTSGSAVNLRGWTIRDNAGHVYTFGNVVIAGNGGQIWLRTGWGTNARSPISKGNLYWKRRQYVWNNTGDTAYLRKPGAKSSHDKCSWGRKAGRTWVGC